MFPHRKNLIIFFRPLGYSADGFGGDRKAPIKPFAQLFICFFRLVVADLVATTNKTFLIRLRAIIPDPITIKILDQPRRFKWNRMRGERGFICVDVAGKPSRGLGGTPWIFRADTCEGGVDGFVIGFHG